MLLTVVAVIGSTASVLEIGPIWGPGERYGLAPEVVVGILQNFLLDCDLILLPLSVMVARSRPRTPTACGSSAAGTARSAS